MNFRRSARSGRTVGRAEAERLLDPTPPAPRLPPTIRSPRCWPLRARPGPVTAGEQAAVAAFRTVRAAGPVPPRPVDGGDG